MVHFVLFSFWRETVSVKLFITYLTLVEIFRPLTFGDGPHCLRSVFLKINPLLILFKK